MCPQCAAPIRFYDNIPVFSYLILRGRCRVCRTPIGLRYPLVELLTGLFAAVVFLRFGANLSALVIFGFIAVLLTVTFIDIDHRIIPNVITLPGIPVFFAAALLLPQITWQDSLIGILVGGGSLLLVSKVYYLIKKTEGMGGGDVKLLAMIGALTGWQGVLFTIFFGSLTGTVAGLAVMVQQRGTMRQKIPFGPFLAIGAITYLFFGPDIISWYFGTLRGPLQ
jgi:leader peptidase (prepilin peptidase)/N-methyltransferase